MKKLFALLLLCVSLCYAEDLTGVMGIKFGSSSDDVLIALKDKQWENTGIKTGTRDNETYIVYYPANYLYGGIKTRTIWFKFYKNKMYTAEIYFAKEAEDPNETNTASSVITLTNLLKKKYNLRLEKKNTLFDQFNCYTYLSQDNDEIYINEEYDAYKYFVYNINFSDLKMRKWIEKDRKVEGQNKFNNLYDSIKDEL